MSGIRHNLHMTVGHRLGISFASDGDPKLSLSPQIISVGMESFGSSGRRLYVNVDRPLVM